MRSAEQCEIASTKHETLNPKQIQKLKFKVFKPSSAAMSRRNARAQFESFDLWTLNLFRISCFGFSALTQPPPKVLFSRVKPKEQLMNTLSDPIRIAIAGLGRAGWDIHAKGLKPREEFKLV